MATEVNQTYFSWSQGGSTERDGPQGVSVSQTLDHGSISFGRFELESLSWEKWSVFTNDRRNEEFGKFNGLVAQKKAYFEEYYKKIRELKASQQQNQQTELILEYSGDGSDSSQTAEDEQGADLETPTGSGAAVDVYVEEALHETMSEHGLQCYDDQGNENFDTEFSSSNLSSSGVLQQTDVRGAVRGSSSTSKMDAGKKNAGSVHGDTRTTYEAARTPRRIIEKDSRLRHSPKIIPKSIKTLSKSAMDYTSERPGSMKPNTSMNQKAKLVQRSSAAAQKMCGPTEGNKHTGLRRPSSAGARRPSTGDRHAIAKENSQLPAVVSTPRRPSTAERRPVTRDRAQKEANVTTPRRPSTSERLPVKRENAAKHNDISAVRRPSTGERRAITRDSVVRTDVKTPSKARATVAHPKGETTTVGNTKKAVTPNAARSGKLETKSNNNRLKGPSVLDSHSTRSKRMDLQASGKQKSSSVNLPPRKIFSSTAGEPAVETISRSKKKEATVQSRASTSKRTTPLQTGNLKARAPNPPAPPAPPPPRRTSRMISKPTGASSIVGRKPKYATHHEHQKAILLRLAAISSNTRFSHPCILTEAISSIQCRASAPQWH